VQDDLDHLASVSSPSKAFYDNILALNSPKNKDTIITTNVIFKEKKEHINKSSTSIVHDDNNFIKQCRSIFIKPSSFTSIYNNPTLISQSPLKKDDTASTEPKSTVMTPAPKKPVEKCSFPNGSIPCVHPFHPSDVTDILRSTPTQVLHIKRKLASSQQNNPLTVVPPTQQSLPKKRKLFMDHNISNKKIESNMRFRFNKYYGKYPTASALTSSSFGRPSKNHSFTSEAVFDHIIIFLIKSELLDDHSLLSLLQVHPLYFHLHASISRFKTLDFRPLSRPNSDFKSQTTIPFLKRMQFLACILHYNFHAGSVFRFLKNNHTNAHINPKKLHNELTGILPPHINNYLYRALKVGAPSKINAHSSRKNFLDYLKYGNHKSIDTNLPLVKKALNKEDKHDFVMHFPAWVARFVPNLHLSPEGILIKPNKNDRIVFDASFKINYDSHSLNSSWTHPWEEPPIYYGTALLRHLTRIWNLRVTYADDEILLWDDDVAGAFRLIKYNPEIAQAFSAIVHNTLWIPTGQVFGGNTSAQNFEGLARARELLAEHLSSPQYINLQITHAKLLNLIKYSTPHHKNTIFTPAVPDSINKGVLDINGKHTNSKHNMFVDDNVIAEIPSKIRQAQAASAESLFRIAGFPDESIRRSPLSMDKYYAAICSYSKKQLGYLINTRTMYVTFPEEKFLSMIQVLQDWHSKRKSYTIKQAARLAGSLEFFASVSPWIRFLSTSLKHSILLALRKNTAHVSKDPHMQKQLS